MLAGVNICHVLEHMTYSERARGILEKASAADSYAGRDSTEKIDFWERKDRRITDLDCGGGTGRKDSGGPAVSCDVRMLKKQP